MQPNFNCDETQVQEIPRLKKTEMNQNIDDDENVLIYKGLKKPPMPCLPIHTPSHEDTLTRNITLQRSDDINFAFLKE